MNGNLEPWAAVEPEEEDYFGFLTVDTNNDEKTDEDDEN